jgi:hypothetical protein
MLKKTIKTRRRSFFTLKKARSCTGAKTRREVVETNEKTKTQRQGKTDLKDDFQDDDNDG